MASTFNRSIGHPKAGILTSKYTFPILEAAPFVLGALAITFWEALQPGPCMVHQGVDYLWFLPSVSINGLAVGYLIYRASGCRKEYYPLTPLTRALLDIIRTYSSCYILALSALTTGLKMLFLMASYTQPYDLNSTSPRRRSDGVFELVCVFLILAYCVVVTGIGFLIAMPFKRDRRALREAEEGIVEAWRERFVESGIVVIR